MYHYKLLCIKPRSNRSALIVIRSFSFLTFFKNINTPFDRTSLQRQTLRKSVNSLATTVYMGSKAFLSSISESFEIVAFNGSLVFDNSMILDSLAGFTAINASYIGPLSSGSSPHVFLQGLLTLKT